MLVIFADMLFVGVEPRVYNIGNLCVPADDRFLCLDLVNLLQRFRQCVDCSFETLCRLPVSRSCLDSVDELADFLGKVREDVSTPFWTSL